MQKKQMDRKKHLIAYLADWASWQAEDLDVKKVSHINYSFALIKDGRVSVDHLEKLDRLKILKERNKDLKIVLSIGGWGADGFSDAALTQDSRSLFTKTAIDIVTEYDFDGLDLDWEYPCRDFAGIKARPEDKANYTHLVRSLRAGLDELSDKTKRPYLLTMAAGAAEIFVGDLELDLLSPLFDYVSIMTYDFHTGSDTVGHHTNLYCFEHDQSISVQKSVEAFSRAGLPTEKIVIGAAFYGRGWSGFNRDLHPIGQKGQGDLSYPYEKIKKAIKEKSLVRYWDQAACAPYLLNDDIFVGYDDPESLRHKVAYVLKEDLAGIMFWEWSKDVDNELLDAIYKAYQGQ